MIQVRQFQYGSKRIVEGQAMSPAAGCIAIGSMRSLTLCMEESCPKRPKVCRVL
jgi:hypothetical protein